MAYLLDSNIFIQAKNLHYDFDFCPAFWDWLDLGYQAGNLLSVRSVGDELIGGTDRLADWAKARDSLFREPSARTLPALSEVANWAKSQKYEPAAINTFLQLADYYLVAEAKAFGHIVVTHEVPSNSSKKIKIPDACIGLNVKFIQPFEMLKREKARFVLGS
jgi:Domain of unknown function (DUF4411)